MRAISMFWLILSRPILGFPIGGWLIFLTFVAFLAWCGITVWIDPSCRYLYNAGEYICP